MNLLTQDWIHPGYETPSLLDFPHAPSNWSVKDTEEGARQRGLALTETHWRVVRALQALYARNAETVINMRDLHDALNEDFHHEGGIRYLYTLFPNGPLAQSCLLASLTLPAGAQDKPA